MSDWKFAFYVKSDPASLLHHWDHRSQSKFLLKIENIISKASRQNNPLHIEDVHIQNFPSHK